MKKAIVTGAGGSYRSPSGKKIKKRRLLGTRRLILNCQNFLKAQRFDFTNY